MSLSTPSVQKNHIALISSPFFTENRIAVFTKYALLDLISRYLTFIIDIQCPSYHSLELIYYEYYVF